MSLLRESKHVNFKTEGFNNQNQKGTTDDGFHIASIEFKRFTNFLSENNGHRHQNEFTVLYQVQ